MDAQKRAELRQIVEAATEGPAIGADCREIFLLTNDEHRAADLAFYRQARQICLALLDELDGIEALPQPWGLPAREPVRNETTI